MDITASILSQRDRALIGGDYSAYHTQATRRIQRIRGRLGVSTPRGKKYTSKNEVTAADVAKNTEWVQLLLASSERAWASALAMKSIQSPENTQKPMAGSTKRQIVSRYHRAINYAQNLVNVVQDGSSKASKQDVLEAKAYLALLKGGLDFERNRWASCITNYSFVRVVYTAISTSAQSDLHRDLLEGTIDPSIRYAAYQEKLPRTKAVSDIAIESFPAAESTSKTDILDMDSKAFETTVEKTASQTEGMTDLPTTIEWRGRRVKLEDATISQMLGVANTKEQKLDEAYSSYLGNTMNSKDLISAYDNIITARQDAADATKTAIDELLSEEADQGDPRIQSLQVTRTAVNYAVIEFRVGRNRVLCGEQDGLVFGLVKPKQTTKLQKDGTPRIIKDEPKGRKIARLRERVGLYDSILQNIDAVKQLPGVVADSTFVQELDHKSAYFRALKCLGIARSHAVNGSTIEALALFSRAHELSQSVALPATSSSSSAGAPQLQVTSDQISTLQSHLSSLTLQYRALAELQKLTTSSKPSSAAAKTYRPPFLQTLHLNQYSDDIDLRNIVNYPPKLQPIPMKPIFYDVAWNYIKYPGQVQENGVPKEAKVNTSVEDEVTIEEKPKKRGWFGFGR